jgi:hypothetical protein
MTPLMSVEPMPKANTLRRRTCMYGNRPPPQVPGETRPLSTTSW